MDTNEFKQDLAIDPNQLDEEWLRHPVLFFRYAEMSSEAQQIRDLAKDNLDVAKAQADKEERQILEGSLGKKPTEAMVAAAVNENELVRHAIEQYNDAVYDYNMAVNAVRAFEHRKKALENLVQLHAAQWFAGPKEPRNLKAGKRMGDDTRAKAAEKQREGLKKAKPRKRAKR